MDPVGSLREEARALRHIAEGCGDQPEFYRSLMRLAAKREQLAEINTDEAKSGDNSKTAA
jgi:hypothetical protein